VLGIAAVSAAGPHLGKEPFSELYPFSGDKAVRISIYGRIVPSGSDVVLYSADPTLSDGGEETTMNRYPNISDHGLISAAVNLNRQLDHGPGTV
jgi:hypothetical protein